VIIKTYLFFIYILEERYDYAKKLKEAIADLQKVITQFNLEFLYYYGNIILVHNVKLENLYF